MPHDPLIPTPPAAPRARAAFFAFALVAALALAAGCAALNQPAPEETVRYEDGGEMGDAAYFHDALSPYGRWVELSPYGLCWLPDGLGPGWSPYSQGFWTYSDYGWTWVDQEAWGWAPFHYGRWWLDPQYGWVWIPGTEWAPAWVAWRENDAYVAWAPLPPTIHWSTDIPLHSGGASVDALPPTWWNVARPTQLFAADLRQQLLPSTDKLTALAQTEDRTRITAKDDKPFNVGPNPARIEGLLGHAIPRYHVVDAPTNGGPTKSGVVADGTLAFFRPDLAAQRAARTGEPADTRTRPAPSRPGNATGLDVFRPHGAKSAATDSTRLETFLAAERKRLASAQAHDRLLDLGRTDPAALADRHDRETRAFEAYAARQRAALRGGQTGKWPAFDRVAAIAPPPKPVAHDSL